MPFHYAPVPLKTDTRQKRKKKKKKKRVETGVVHMYRHDSDENTEARSQTGALTTLRLSTYPHSHYSDEPNKEMHTVLFTQPHVTHTVNTRTNQTDT